MISSKISCLSTSEHTCCEECVGGEGDGEKSERSELIWLEGKEEKMRMGGLGIADDHQK